MEQRKFDEPVPVLDDSGKPENFGWASVPLFSYNPSLIRSPRGKINESDRYIVFSSANLLQIEVLDAGYLGYVGITVLSFRDGKRTTQVYKIPFPLGGFVMPRDSDSGSVKIEKNKTIIDFIAMEGGSRIIKLDIPKFGHSRSLRGAVILSKPAQAESLVTNTPWREDKHAFRYSRRSPWYIAEGVLQFGVTEIAFVKDHAWGIFDWNRGVRPRQDVRYWAAGCGMNNGEQLGFSVGYGSSDSSFCTENAFFLNGRINKLDQVTFNIPPVNWLNPWHFTSNDERLTMTFTPAQERAEKNGLGLYSMKRRQVYGSFSGTVILDTGEKLAFQNIQGFAERKKTRF